MSQFEDTREFMSNHIEEYSDCLKDIKIDTSTFTTSNEFNLIILSMINDWDKSEIVKNTIKNLLSLNKCTTAFDKQIIEIALIMQLLDNINQKYKNRNLSINLIYKKALKIYSTLYPDEYILFKTIAIFKQKNKIDGSNICTCIIISSLIVALVNLILFLLVLQVLFN